MKCKDCLSYHPLSKWAGWCGLWREVAISDQICIAWKERPKHDIMAGKEKPNGIKLDSGQREITGD